MLMLTTQPAQKAEFRLPEDMHKEVPWDGIPFQATTLAVDTETVVEYQADGTTPRSLSEHNPQLVLMAVSDGERNVIVRPEQVPHFVHLHYNCHWVFHNLAFDFWVIDRRLDGQNGLNKDWIDLAPTNTGCVQFTWWWMLDNGKLHDSMLLDQLVRLARGVGDLPSDAIKGEADKLPERNLDELAKDYQGLRVDKDSPYRLRFGDLLERDDWNESDLEGYIDYALGDVIALAQIWPKLWARALELAPLQREHGPLTEQIQVKAAVALRKVSLNGLHFDPVKARAREKEYRHQANRLIAQLYREHPTTIHFPAPGSKGQKGKRKAEVTQGLFVRFKTRPGRFQVADKSGLPKMSAIFLRRHLSKIAHEKGFEPPFSKGKTKNLVSASVKDWEEYAHYDPFIHKWQELSKLSKVLGFFYALRQNAERQVIHSTYYPLLRTGRTSNRVPNTQQFPRTRSFRAMFTPRRGYKLYTIDYAAIELCTFSSIAGRRFNFSKMAEIICEGKDPHCYTVSILRARPYEDIYREYKAEKKTVDQAKENGLHYPLTPISDDRQASKAALFGLLGGLGAPKLASYARASYGVEMTEKQASVLRDSIVNDVYPEIKLYLQDTALFDFAHFLRLEPEEVTYRLQRIGANTSMLLYCLGQVVMSTVDKPATSKSTGKPYDHNFVNKLWLCLRDLLNLSPRRKEFKDLLAVCESKNGSYSLYRYIFGTNAITPTGRIRSGCSYTQRANTPFQGLAADGAKLAIYRLIRKGHRVVAFIHDEVLVEVPEDKPEQCQEIEKILVEEMNRVLGGIVPASASGVLADCWQKG